ILPQDTYRAGDKITGTVRIESGKVDQEVNKVYLQLLVHAHYGGREERKEVKQILHSSEILQPLVVKAGETAREFPVEFQIPLTVPISTPSTRFFVLTGLDVSKAVDPGDSDPIIILPDWRREVAKKALEKELGFRPIRDSGEYNGRHQEFEYVPTGFMRGKLDELEAVFQPSNDGIRLFLEIDKKGGMLELFDLDERHVSCFIPDNTLQSPQETARFLAGFIEREFKKI
ncbi:MAG: sporulation protein, partial [Bacillota bacterium]